MRLRSQCISWCPRWVGACGGLLLWFGCHDAPRHNPLDPELTPAVELTAAADDIAGTVALSWTPYAGAAAFRAYLVLRNTVHSTEVETLFVAPSPDSIRFVDRTRQPDTAYEYRVAAVNRAGLSRESVTVTVPGFTVTGVRLLAAEPDSLAGSVRLRWTRFTGPGFKEYRVIRRVTELAREEPLAQLTAAVDTVYTDTTAQAGIPYIYRVEVEGAGRLEPGNLVPALLRLPAVSVRAVFSSPTASARLTWSTYRGPRFAGYRLERRSPGLDWSDACESAALEDTVFTDKGLLGNTAYSYRVVVLTSVSEAIEGPEASGRIHGLVGTWPVDLRFPYGMRLARSDPGQIAVLAGRMAAASTQTVYLLDPDGGTLSAPQLVGGWGALGPAPRGGDLAFLPGDLFVSLADGPAAGVLRYTVGGEEATVTRELFARAPLPLLQGDQATVLGEVLFSDGRGTSHLAETSLYSGAVLARTDSFTTGAPEGWQTTGSGSYNRYYGIMLGVNITLSHRDSGWTEPGVRARVLNAGFGHDMNGRFTVRLGGDTSTRLSLALDWQEQQAELVWTFAPPPGSSLPARETRFVEPLGLLAMVPYTVGLQVVDGHVQVSLTSPVVLALPNPSGRFWTSVASLGSSLALTVFDSAFVVSPDGDITRSGRLPGGVSEIRTWTSRRGIGMGVCLPEMQRLLVGDVPAGTEASWPEQVATEIGPLIASGQGFLSYPVSFDVGPDGRIFVLDAGLRRVVVFGRDRKYLTRWGGEGSREGEFSLGLGTALVDGTRDLGGSIAVDDSGFVYIADPGNQRIQKFAP